MKPEPETVTVTYRWGVVAADEPVDVRTIKGYVTILEHQNSLGAPMSYSILFFDADGLPISHFGAEDFSLFVGAAILAWGELGLPGVLVVGEAAALVPLAK